MIDSNDRERFDETKAELKKVLAEDEIRDAVICIFCNKQDLPNCMTIAEITERLDLQSLNRKWNIFGGCAKSGDGLFEMFDWIVEQFGKKSSSSSSSSFPLFKLNFFKRENSKGEKMFDPLAVPDESELLQRFETEDSNEINSEIFLEKFREGIINSFDHKAHLRIGFLVLYRSNKEGISNSAAVQLFINLLKTFFRNAPSNQIRQTFHVTMTMFWCQIIHLSLASFLQENSDEILNSNDENELFNRFIRKNIMLMWGGLWTVYYSKNVMMSPEARSRFVLPDLRPLPSFALQSLSSYSSNLNPKPLIKNTNNNNNNNDNNNNNLDDSMNQSNSSLSDEEFFSEFNEDKLSEFDELSLVRICYLYFQYKVQRDGERRGKVISDLMDKLQSSQIKYNFKNSLKNLPPLPYSKTVTYFWVQVINVALSSLSFSKNSISVLQKLSNNINNNNNNNNNDVNNNNKENNHQIALEGDEEKKSRIPFRTFITIFPELLPTQKPWLNYYSEKVFNSLESRRSFVNPDKKPLPNYFSTRETSDTFLINSSALPVRPPISQLLSVLDKISPLIYKNGEEEEEENNNKKNIIDIVGVKGEFELGLEKKDEIFTELLITGKLTYLSHLSFIRLIFCTIKLGWDRGDRGTIAIAKIIDHFESFFSNFQKGNLSQSNNEVIEYFKSKSIEFNGDEQKIFLDLIGGNKEEYSEYWGYTFTHFWIQMVITSMVECSYSNPSLLSSFVSFLNYSPELMWYKLWNLYYSELLITTPEAKAIVVPPDLHKLPSYIKTPTKQSK